MPCNRLTWIITHHRPPHIDTDTTTVTFQVACLFAPQNIMSPNLTAMAEVGEQKKHGRGRD